MGLAKQYAAFANICRDKIRHSRDATAGLHMWLSLDQINRASSGQPDSTRVRPRPTPPVQWLLSSA